MGSEFGSFKIFEVKDIFWERKLYPMASELADSKAVLGLPIWPRFDRGYTTGKQGVHSPNDFYCISSQSYNLQIKIMIFFQINAYICEKEEEEEGNVQYCHNSTNTQ